MNIFISVKTRNKIDKLATAAERWTRDQVPPDIPPEPDLEVGRQMTQV